VKIQSFGGLRTGVTYGKGQNGNGEVRMLIDETTGEIIHYNKDL